MTGAEVARRRRAIGMTGELLSHLVGAAPNTLYRIEVGTRRASPRLARRIELVLCEFERTHARMQRLLAEASAA
jgi:hypothetical protein